MNLLDVYNDKSTPGSSDKGTCHSYIEWYNEVLTPYQHTADSVLEIGVWFGDSIELWRKYFTKATIYGIDFNPQLREHEVESFHNRNCIVSQELNAYSHDAIQWFSNVSNQSKIDVLIDDGSHLESHQIWLLEHWGHMMNDGGIIVIEDVQLFNKMGSPDILDKLSMTMENVSYPFKSYEVVDRTEVKQRYDDILFVVYF